MTSNATQQQPRTTKHSTTRDDKRHALPRWTQCYAAVGTSVPRRFVIPVVVQQVVLVVVRSVVRE